jgi:hypothetical protein
MLNDPFSRAALNEIFQVSPKHPDRLNSRENTRLEFKRTFHFASGAEYGRTCAAFANREGGYMVFGVDKAPHKMVGLQSKSFEEIDPERVTKILNEYFAPEIRWAMHLHEFMGFVFGILYVSESIDKPVICCKAGDDVKEGQIYYRYSGRTQPIKYAELRQLIEERRRQEELLWLRHIRRIARVGVRDAGIFDVKTGITKGAQGNFIIDESLLPQLRFIREGEFDEKRGAPAVKIIGKAEIARKELIVKGRRVARSQAIRTPDIIQAFLDGRKVAEAIEFLDQVCFESSAYLPIYFLIIQARLSLPKAKDHVDGIKSTLVSKGKLIERLSGSDDLSVAMPSGRTQAGLEKLTLRSALLEGKLSLAKDGKNAVRQLNVIRTLNEPDLQKPFVWEFCRQAFEKFYGFDSQVSAAIRYALSFMDRVINRPKLEKNT